MIENQAERETIHDQTKREQNSGASKSVQQQLLFRLTLRETFRKRKRHGHADDKKKERKNPISESPAVPDGMLELRIAVFPRTGIVDENHRRDRRAAKDVE